MSSHATILVMWTMAGCFPYRPGMMTITFTALYFFVGTRRMALVLLQLDQLLPGAVWRVTVDWDDSAGEDNGILG